MRKVKRHEDQLCGFPRVIVSAFMFLVLLGMGAEASSAQVATGQAQIQRQFVQAAYHANFQNQKNQSETAPSGRLPVAFVVSEHFNLMDFAGPWEVFGAAGIPAPGTTAKRQPRITTTWISSVQAPRKPIAWVPGAS